MDRPSLTTVPRPTLLLGVALWLIMLVSPAQDTGGAAGSTSTPSSGPSSSPSAGSGSTLTPDPASTKSSASTADGHTQSGSYVLRDNDALMIVVFQEPDMTTETRISKTGNITFPLLGSLHLEGKTIDEATTEIRTKLDKDYIINPHVTVTVLEYAKQWVTVLGEVQRPGQVEMPPEGGLDLLGAIAQAGGYTRIANPSRVIVRRIVNGKDVILQVDAKKLARDVQVQQFVVQPGDRINVGESLF